MNEDVGFYLSELSREELNEVLDNTHSLGEHEKNILFYRYFQKEKKSLRELGVIENISGERVRQLQVIGIRKVKSYLIKTGKIAKPVIDPLTKGYNNVNIRHYMKKDIQESLRVEVLTRFLSEEELKKLVQDYNNNKHTLGASDRFTFLSQQINSEDLELVNFYLTDKNKNIKEYCQEKDLDAGTFYQKVTRLATRILYQLIEKEPELLSKLDIRVEEQ